MLMKICSHMFEYVSSLGELCDYICVCKLCDDVCVCCRATVVEQLDLFSVGIRSDVVM